MNQNPGTPDSQSDIWIVEDNETFRDTLVALLEADPLLTCTLATERCEDLLTALHRGRMPSLVLLDLGLPGLSGLEGIRQIRQLAPTLTVLVITVESDDQHVFDALCAGASGYLLKPANRRQIIEGIHAALNGGSPISPPIARKLLSVFTTLRSPSPDYGLTARERQILQLLVDANTQRQIAVQLALSPHTVDAHVRNIYQKLHVQSRSGAIAKATRERLI